MRLGLSIGLNKPSAPYIVRNLLSKTEEFENATWAKTRTSVVADTIAGPFGPSNADSVRALSTASEDKRVAQTITVASASGAYTGSMFVKAGAVSWCALSFFTLASSRGTRRFVNLSTGAVGTTNDFNSPVSPTFAVSDAGDGWWRIAAGLTKSSLDTQASLMIFPAAVDGTLAYAAANTTDAQIYLFGGQVDFGALTSYQRRP